MSARVAGERVRIHGDQAHPIGPRHDLAVLALPVVTLLVLLLLSFTAGRPW
jgi:hypothetical protein